jgi:CHASE3 domain sensor protein
MTEGNGHTKVSIDDIRAKFHEIAEEVDERVDSARKTTTIIVVVGGVALVAIAFWLGARRGRSRQTILEIRRV